MFKWEEYVHVIEFGEQKTKTRIRFDASLQRL